MSGKYKTIVADPPWSYRSSAITKRTGAVSAGAEAHYETMSNEQLAALPVKDWAAKSAHLYMWVTNPILAENRREGEPNPSAIARAWGFEPITLLTWLKGENGAGMGFYFRGDTEHVLFGVRRDLPIPTELRESNVFRSPRGEHSSKPDCFLDKVERVSPGPYLEMFARRARFGWDYHGDQSLETAQMPVPQQGSVVAPRSS